MNHIDELLSMCEKVRLHGGKPDQAITTYESVYQAGETPGGVGDPATGLTLMWMEKLADGSIDPSKVCVSVNESVNPFFIVESDTPIRVRMIQAPGCELPPPGWWCSRTKGHLGPCAARRLR